MTILRNFTLEAWGDQMAGLGSHLASSPSEVANASASLSSEVRLTMPQLRHIRALRSDLLAATHADREAGRGCAPRAPLKLAEAAA